MPSDLARLHKRDGSANFQLHITVPADLRQHFNGRTTIRESLGTADRKEAEARRLSRALEVWQEFCRLRQPAPVQRPSLNQGRFLAEALAYLQDRANEESRRIAQLVAEGRDNERDFAASSWYALDSALADEVDPEYGQPPHKRIENEENRAAASAVLDRLGLTLDALNPADRAWALREAEALRFDLYAIMEECCAASPTDTVRAEVFRRRSAALPVAAASPVVQAPASAPKPAQPRRNPHKAQTLRDLMPEWQELAEARPEAVQDMKRALDLWEAATGNPAVHEITRATGATFRAWLLRQPFKRKTAKNHADCINALMNAAVDCEKVEVNPLRMKIRINDSEEREPWLDSELALIHGTPITDPQPLAVEAADAELLLSLLLWSGARIGEVAALRVEDIQEREGVLAAYIRRETTKTEQSVRWLPIARPLRDKVRVHAQRRKDQGHTDLMPSFTRVKGRAAGDQAGRWFLKHREALGLPLGKLNGSHRYRHSVRTRLAGFGVTDALADAITGHAPAKGASTGRRVYTGTLALPAVLDAIELLAWPWPAQ